MLLWQGAVENLLERSSFVQLFDGSIAELDQVAKNAILDSLHDMSGSALRCLGFAYKEDLEDFASYDGEDHPAHELLLNPSSYSDIEKNLIFVGFAGIRVSLWLFMNFMLACCNTWFPPIKLHLVLFFFWICTRLICLLVTLGSSS